MIKEIIYKTGSAVSLIAFSMWFGRDWDYEPFIGVVASVVALICAEKFSNLPELNKWDERLANKFLEQLPSFSSAIGLLRDHDFNASFVHEDWIPIREFYNYWTDPDHEFNNKKLSKKMKAFLTDLSELKKLVGTYTSPMDNHHRLQKIHENADEQIANEMNHRASDAFTHYSDFCGLLKQYNFGLPG